MAISKESVVETNLVTVARRFASHVLPWLITLVALYFAFNDVDWAQFVTHVGEAELGFICFAFILTCCSYLMRSRRWQYLFPQRPFPLSYLNSTRVLILGFFMNNILPARAGEFVRAHLGSKVSHCKRTLVLATIASERLLDGLTLSVLFLAFAFRLGNAQLSHNLLYVAFLFTTVSAAVLLTLVFRSKIFSWAEKIHTRVNSRFSRYVFERFQIFITGLSPLSSPRKLAIIGLWSIAIWSIELLVYVLISLAFGEPLSLSLSVLFLVVVNFSSLIPAAPGGIGVIEAIASAVLMSVGIPREKALTMVITQHVIQYLVVGIPGALAMITWKSELKQLRSEDDKEA